MTKERHSKTPTAIRLAITQLLSHRSFESITVTAICQTAGINRGTFYLHYLDKFDMMDQMKAETLDTFMALLAQTTTDCKHLDILPALEYVEKNRKFFYALSQSQYVNLPLAIRELLENLFDNMPNFPHYLRNLYGISETYAKTAHIGAIEAIITDWILAEQAESPQVMAKVLEDFSNR
ncbi:TetR/AcrR family transcriptional regulator [Streptococcus sp. DD12]|uniref:TetR/AcrR family transcriptional regulator n=1 Tax=Streptococcus sp. DD12 TaxID=1777880 RepID=UPI00079B0B4B|nr:TetR/AcrR family transcriptional regulator [Streptococcus sp. DD12]KXT76587.1 Transcriptional regulator, TetR family [Streptococcus sp. DD12]